MDHMILNNYLFINIYTKTVLFAPNYQLFYFNIAKIIFKSKGTYIAKTMILFLKNILHQKCIKSVTGFMKNVVFMIKLFL